MRHQTHDRARSGKPAGVLAALPALALLAASACTGDTGTISLRLVTAPDSTLLTQVRRARLRLSDPPTVVEAVPDQDGSLALVLDVPVGDRPAAVTFEGFDEGGDLIAFGQSGLLPIAAITVDIAIHVAPPMSVTRAPALLAPARTDMGVAVMDFGVVLAGGDTGAGASDAVSIYSVYTHALAGGAPLDEPRIAPAAATGAGDVMYLFGGLGADGVPRDTFSAFSPSIGPLGVHLPLDTEGQGLARAGARMAPLGQDRFVITGDPLLLADGVDGRAGALTDAPALDGTATTAFVDGTAYTLFAGAGSGNSGAALLARGQLTELAPPDAVRAALRRTAHAAVVLPDGSMLVVTGALVSPDDMDDAPDDPGEATRAAVRFQPATGAFQRLDDFLATARIRAAVAATDAHLVVAGGLDRTGAVAGDVEVFDARTLAPVAVLPLLVPRHGAVAAPLSNGQVLIAGGVDEAGAPVAVMELFTPAAADGVGRLAVDCVNCGGY